MAKFVIECPECGRYVEAKNGLFAKSINCYCGHLINIRTEKMTSRICPHCGNNVLFDQSKGKKAKCPICQKPINTIAEQDKTVEFSCAQCGVRLQTQKGDTVYTCPICSHVNDVAERVKNEQIKRDSLISVIKYEGDNEALVWKHPVEDFQYGSQLIVHESQEAIFFKDGQALDLFGSGRYTLETQSLPLLEKLYNLPTEMDGAFHSEVYYINKTTHMGIKWGTDSKVPLFDPGSGLHVELGASGEFSIRVSNSRKLLLKIVGTTSGINENDILFGGKGLFRAMIMAEVKSRLAQVIRESNISILEIYEHLIELSEALSERLKPRLSEYGLELTEFFVSRVVVPDDENFAKLRAQYAERTLGIREEQNRRDIAMAEAERRAVEAGTDARMKIIGAQGDAEALKIQKAAEVEAYRMKAAAEAEEMRIKGYTYQQETARKVGLEAMQNGIGGGAGDGIGDLASLGITLGAMGSVVNMTKDVLNPVIDTAANAVGSVINNTVPDSGWDCKECGTKGITSKFCPECGTKRPIEVPKEWSCPECKTQNITSKFCPECGHPRV